ncbi:hypothetical protein NDU88_000260 [Pleurodeles waltl]|uniref:Uncharacterized protein n=1 Tax=Pleurodeles waltl TaxID=8319 RepID=A0AAV7TG65_PLEWA|nr:hypothetical protein NDU88_000260 [Pleurodeles waltl]
MSRSPFTKLPFKFLLVENPGVSVDFRGKKTLIGSAWKTARVCSYSGFPLPLQNARKRPSPFPITRKLAAEEKQQPWQATHPFASLGAPALRRSALNVFPASPGVSHPASTLRGIPQPPKRNSNSGPPKRRPESSNSQMRRITCPRRLPGVSRPTRARGPVC